MGLFIYLFSFFFFLPQIHLKLNGMEQEEAVKWKAPEDTHWLGPPSPPGFLFGGRHNYTIAADDVGIN